MQNPQLNYDPFSRLFADDIQDQVSGGILLRKVVILIDHLSRKIEEVSVCKRPYWESFFIRDVGNKFVAIIPNRFFTEKT